MNIKIEKNISLRVKVAEALREIIESNEHQAGQIPNENELAEKMGVSRGTIRQALSILEEEGLVLRRQGSGTYINPHVLQFNVRADLPFRFVELIEKAGFGASVKLLGCWESPAPGDIAQKLLVDEGCPLLWIKRLFFAREKPAIYVVDCIPLEYVLIPFDENELTGLLFDFLQNNCNMQASYTLSELVPSVANPEIAQILDIPAGTPLLQCSDIHFNTENHPVICAQVFYKDEIIRFSVLRKMNPSVFGGEKRRS